MRALLDTHCWLWWISAPENLSQEALEAIRFGGNEIYFSAASSWEISIKVTLGKLVMREKPSEFVPARLARDGILPLPIQHAHALQVAGLPYHHRDPFDRMLVAQAQMENLTLLTADRQLEKYDVRLLFCGKSG
ncbi:MAG: type II toxin-antitoxin system VapC family toxin [Spirochaetia bacterium]|jgi:PIN domain nuclease of toxin-antitoxin system